MRINLNNGKTYKIDISKYQLKQDPDLNSDKTVVDTINSLYTNEVLNTIYVSGSSGNDSNDGTESKPFRTAQKAFSYLCSLGSKTLFGQWKIKFGEGTYTYAKISNLSQFSKHLLIEGTRDGNGNIVSIFQCDGTNYIGLWLEPMRGNAVTVQDLKFVGYKKGFNGYGVIGKNQGYLYINSCEAEDCDCGFAGINNVTLTCHKTIVRNSSYGFRSQYCSAATIGAGTGGSHMSNGGNGCEVYNCDVGFLVTRNSVAHSDYVKYIDCNVGVRVEMNSRVATLSNVYTRCKTNGVEVQGGGEWIGGVENEIDTWENCTTPYTMQGNGRYTRLQSLYCKNEFLFVCKTQKELIAEASATGCTNSVTGTTSKTMVYRMSPSVCIPPYYLDSNFTKIRVVVRGAHQTIAESYSTITATFFGLTSDNQLDGNNFGAETSIKVQSDTLGSFTASFEFTFKKFTNADGDLISDYQYVAESFVSKTTGGDEHRSITRVPSNRPSVSNKQQLRLYVTPNSEENIVEIRQVDVYLLN